MARMKIQSRLLIFSLLLFAGLSFCFSSSGLAQPAKDKNEKGAKKDSDVIIVPFQNLGKMLDGAKTNAIIPYEDYLRFKRFENATKKPLKLPAEAIISKATYTATVKGNLATIDVEFEIRSLVEKGWATLPLRFGDSALGSWKSDVEKVLLKGGKKGEYLFLLPKKGDYKIRLKLLATVKTTPDGRSFSLSCPSVGITTFDVTVPKPDQSIEMTPNLVALDSKSKEGTTHIKASLGATESVTVRWSPKVSKKPQMELLTSVTNLTRITIQDDLIHTDATFEYDILRGELNEIRFVVPNGYRILDVTTKAKVKGWKVEKQKDRQVVTLPLISPATKKLVVEVHTESDLPKEEFQIFGLVDKKTPFGIHTLSTLRESGQIVVRHDSETEVAVIKRKGLVRIDHNEIAASLKTNANLAFKFYNPNVALKINSKPVLPKVSVSNYTQVTFKKEELRSATSLAYHVERAGIFELKVKVPKGMQVDQVQLAQMKDWNHDKNSGVLSITLQRKQQGDLLVAIQSHLTYEKESAKRQLEVPILEPLNVEQETGTVSLFVAPSLELMTDQEKIVSAQPMVIRRGGGGQQSDGQQGGVFLVDLAQPASSWTFSKRPVKIPVKTIAKPSHLSVEVGTFVNVGQEIAEIETTLNYHVKYAGIDTFRFTVPEAVSKKIQIAINGRSNGVRGDGISIRQKSPAKEAKEGWIVWTVITQRPVLGIASFKVTYDIPVKLPEEAGEGKSLQVSLPAFAMIRPLGTASKEGEKQSTPISKLTGEISVNKEKALSVSAQVTGGDAEPIDLRERKLLAGNAVFASRYYSAGGAKAGGAKVDGKKEEHKPVQLKLKVQKYEIKKVIRTVVSHAKIEIVLGQDNIARYRCRYRIRSSERQRLPILLPKGSEPYAILIDDRPVLLEKGDIAAPKDWDAYYISVARTKSSDASFQLTLLLSWGVNPAPFQFWQGKMQLPMPSIGLPGEADSAVQQIRATVWVPKEYSLVGEPNHFSLLQGPMLRKLFPTYQNDIPDNDDWNSNHSSKKLDFPTHGVAYHYSNLGGTPLLEVRWWHSVGFTVVLSGIIAIIGLILVRTSWENKIGFLVLTALGIVLWAQVDADLMIHAVVAARFGFFALLATWAISFFANGWHLLTTPKNNDDDQIAVATAATESASESSEAETNTDDKTDSEAEEQPPES